MRCDALAQLAFLRGQQLLYLGSQVFSGLTERRSPAGEEPRSFFRDKTPTLELNFYGTKQRIAAHAFRNSLNSLPELNVQINVRVAEEIAA